MFKPNCQMTLFRQTVLPDGSSVFDEGKVFSAFLMEHFRTLKDGSIEDFSEVLMVPEALPAPGDQLQIKGLRRTVARVRSCIDVQGNVRCYRCSFLRS